MRFIYAHPKSHYLSIYDSKDIIELPVNEVLDISGWDIRKSLKFIGKTNATIYEWYQSPIVYIRETNFLNQLSQIGNDFFSPRAAMHHYLSMTINTFEGSLKSEKVKLKKYFYALRPILAAEWIAQNGTVPPMEFSKLRAILNDKAINEQIDKLLALKANADEKFEFAPNKILNLYIEQRISALKTVSDTTEKKESDSTALNDLFRKTIKEAHGNK